MTWWVACLGLEPPGWDLSEPVVAAAVVAAAAVVFYLT